jgi:hypothetical protein
MLKLTIFDLLIFHHIFLRLVTQNCVITIIMAVNQAALNNYLTNTLGFTEPLAHALNVQGLDAFDILATLSDKDIKEMCANIRKPGGAVP